MFDLLNREIEEKTDKEEEREGEKLRRHKPDHHWANWLPGFFNYAGTVVHTHPEMALAFIQYMGLIYRAYVDFLGHVWLLYHEGFCMRAALCPSMQWHIPQHIMAQVHDSILSHFG